MTVFSSPCANLENAYYVADLERLRLRAEEGARIGFTGKQVIHPDQVPVVKQAFSPSQDQVTWASGLIEAWNEHQKSGKVGGD